MTWRKDGPLEPEQGPKLSEEQLERIVQEHNAHLDAEQDRLAEMISMRMQLARYTTSWPDSP